MLLNLQSYNTTVSGAGLIPLDSPLPRGEVEYTLQLLIPDGSNTPNRTRRRFAPGTPIACVRRLLANGSDAITGITWDGWSYNYELDGGRPVRLGNVTSEANGERVVVAEGGDDDEGRVSIRVRVPDSSAALVDLEFGGDGGGQGLDCLRGEEGSGGGDGTRQGGGGGSGSGGGAGGGAGGGGDGFGQGQGGTVVTSSALGQAEGWGGKGLLLFISLALGTGLIWV